MKTQLALVLAAVAGSVSAQTEDARFPDGPVASLSSEPPVADTWSAPEEDWCGVSPAAGGDAVDIPGYPSEQSPPPPAAPTPADPGVVRAEPVQPAPPPPVTVEIPQPVYTPAPLPVSDAESYQYFYQPLRPYGEWVLVTGHGPCWRPGRVAVGWRPYFDGRWVWTDCGWSWVSVEPWGWATYHYGRWMLTPEFGWVWVPGRTWAPAWVCWQSGPGFVGWAPLPPATVVGVGFCTEVFGIRLECWTMVRERDFLAPRCASVAFHHDECRRLLPRGNALAGVGRVNNVIVNVGPSHRHVETVTGHRVPKLHLRETTVSSHRPPASVERNALVVGRPASSQRSRDFNVGRVERPGAAPVVRINPQPQPAPRATSPTGPAKPDARDRKAQPSEPRNRPQSRITSPPAVAQPAAPSHVVIQPQPSVRISRPSLASPMSPSTTVNHRATAPAASQRVSNVPASRASPPVVQRPPSRQTFGSPAPSQQAPASKDTEGKSDNRHRRR
jgi:hypothetical protein